MRVNGLLLYLCSVRNAHAAIRKIHFVLQALQHALSLQYVSAAKVHNKLGKEVTLTEAKKLVERMAADGYIEVVASDKRKGEESLLRLLFFDFSCFCYTGHPCQMTHLSFSCLM
jgi:hypothetical protein